MDFTREPVVQSIITPKDGCKLVVRSSKGSNQEEFFVDSVEIVSFGEAFFFRSLEKPKNFLLPVSDYEVLEVREARMVLKHVGVDRSIKIGGGRETQARSYPKEAVAAEKVEALDEATSDQSEERLVPAGEGKQDPRLDKKRDRRRHTRRRRSRDERDEPVREEGSSEPSGNLSESSEKKVEIPEPSRSSLSSTENAPAHTGILTTLLPPPPTLISETIARYREDALFREAFYTKAEKAPVDEREGEETKETLSAAGSSESSDEGQNPSHPIIPNEEEAGKELQDWNFTEELSNNNKNP